MIPTWIGALVILLGVFADGSRIITLEVVACLFGATAAVELPSLAGATVAPSVVVIPFLAVRAWLERRPGALDRVPSAAFWLALTALWGLLSAVAIPRLLYGYVDVQTFDRTGDGAGTFPLRPTSGNITQVAYAFAGVLIFVSMRALLLRPGRMQTFARAVLVLAAANGIAAGLGIVEFYVGFPKLLDLVRTAHYAILNSSEQDGLVRIQGTFAETSAFSAFTLPLFAFASSLWLSRAYSPAAGVLALVSLLLLLFSTSTTAYAGLLVYVLFAALGLLRHRLSTGTVPRGRAIAIGLGVALVAGCLVCAWSLAPLMRVVDFFDATMVRKMDSDSAIERGSWNRLAWGNFLDTFGLGVGLGSVRASSFAIVLVSNLGLIGTGTFVAFLANVLRSPRTNDDSPQASVAGAARQACVATLIGACISGTGFDLGSAFYAFSAAATVGQADLEWP